MTRVAIAALLCISLFQAAWAVDWEIANNGLAGYSTVDVLIDHTNPNVLYCTCKDGIYKSTNGGASWVKSSNGLSSSASAGQIRMDPANSNRLYATVNDSTGSFVWRSDDAGASWQKKANGIMHPYIATVEVSPISPSIVYCGTIIGGRNGGFFMSVDYGDTWYHTAGSDVPGSGMDNDCAPIATDPTNLDRLYCARTHYTDVIRSTDGGLTWTWSGQYFNVRAILVDRNAPHRVIIAGNNHLKLSTDYGQTYVNKITGEQFQCLTAAPSNSNIIYAATTSRGIYRSNDAGASWAQVSGSEIYGFNRISVHPTNPDIIYCVTAGRGIAKSTDDGHSFTFLNSGLPIDVKVRYMISPPGAGITYALVDYVGLYRTFDEGATWQFVSSVPYFPKGLAADPRNPSTLYYVGLPLDQVFKSTDEGFNWSPLPSAPPDDYFTAFAVDPFNSDKLFVAGYPSNKIYRTLDGGQTWQAVLTVTPMPDWWSTSIGQIIIDPTDPNRVYASTYSYPRRSTDGGTTWTTLTNLHYEVLYGTPGTPHDTSYIRDMAIDPRSPNVIYACTQWGGTWKSTDYGDTWTRIFGDHLYITNNVIIDSRDSNVLYMSSLGGYSGVNRGIYRSTDAGASWTEISSGLEGNDTYPNLVHQASADPSRFFTGASINGVYRSPGGDWGLSLAQARALPDGGYCAISGDPVVSLLYGDGSGCVQSLDRLTGLRAIGIENVSPGDRVQIQGLLYREDGDVWMYVQKAQKTGEAGLPRALSICLRNENSDFAPLGVRSRVWGKVIESQPESGYCLVDDGSGKKIKVKLAPWAPVIEGTYAVFEGILGQSGEGESAMPCLYVHGADGVLLP